MTADLLALLDQLDEARAKATPGTWEVHRDASFRSVVTRHDGVAEFVERADAACIVAEHNALPKLTAALRAVLDLIDPAAEMATGNGYDSTRLFDEKDIRAAIAEAIEVSA